MLKYNTTKGQVITLWLMGILLFFVGIAGYTLLHEIIAVVTFPILVFYTLGWKKKNRAKK